MSKRTAGGLIRWTALIALAVGGCVVPVQQDTLTVDEKASVDAVATQVTWDCAAISTVHLLAEAELNFDTIQNGQFGDCPAVTYSSTTDDATISANFAANGCSSESTGGETVAGTIAVTAVRATRNASITFDAFSIQGQSITGSAAVNVTNTAADTVTLTGTIDITVSGVGSASGGIVARVLNTGQVVASTAGAALVITDLVNNRQITITMNEVTVIPTTANGYIPVAGSVTFTETNGDGTVNTFVITFLAQTAIDGSCHVRVNDLPETTHKIPRAGK